MAPWMMDPPRTQLGTMDNMQLLRLAMRELYSLGRHLRANYALT